NPKASNAPSRKFNGDPSLKAVVILPFEHVPSIKEATGLTDQTRTAVLQFLREEELFSAVLVPEDAKEIKKDALLELNATLVDFSLGNMATRVFVGLGTGRAHAGWDVTVKNTATGQVLWKKRIKETASFWSNSASSSAQRLELPEKVAKA